MFWSSGWRCAQVALVQREKCYIDGRQAIEAADAMLKCACAGKLSVWWLLTIPFVAPGSIEAMAHPIRPVHIVLPVPPGGLQDSLARAMAPELIRIRADRETYASRLKVLAGKID